MSKEYEKWIIAQDEAIKTNVERICRENNIKVDFKGYYIEENELRGSIDPEPIYKSFEEYNARVNDYTFIEHVRYFFELKNVEETKTLTIRFYENEPAIFSMCIEDIVELSDTVDNVTYGHLYPIHDLIAKKFSN